MILPKLLKLALGTCLISSISCTPNIKDFDAEKMEYDQIQKIKKAQADPFNNPTTPDHVKVADNDDIYVTVTKGLPIKGHEGIKLDVWNIYAVNRSHTPKCVMINWKLQDFELESPLPYDFLIQDKESIQVGRATQTIWSFDGVAIAIPPSGYVDGMHVRDAEFDEKTHKFICEELEKNIQES